METASETVPTVREMLEQFVPVHFPKLARRTAIDGLRHVEILCEPRENQSGTGVYLPDDVSLIAELLALPSPATTSEGQKS